MEETYNRQKGRHTSSKMKRINRQVAGVIWNCHVEVCGSSVCSLQGDLQVAGVSWKGRGWRFEGRRRICRVVGGMYLSVVVVYLIGVIYLNCTG